MCVCVCVHIHHNGKYIVDPLLAYQQWNHITCIKFHHWSKWLPNQSLRGNARGVRNCDLFAVP